MEQLELLSVLVRHNVTEDELETFWSRHLSKDWKFMNMPPGHHEQLVSDILDQGLITGQQSK